ncbi:MAG: hypothetical protein JKY65_28420 [Planctomycetes bacterium]|nr:hypothetical protein [Planctomycetota bacterium]
MSWDDAKSRAFCARLVARREVSWGLSPGGLGQLLVEQEAPGWAWLAFAERLGEASSWGALESRLLVAEGDRTTSVPASVREGLNANQKPFHLWNVERIVEKPHYRLVEEPPYRVGGAAAEDPDAPRGMPSDTTTTTRQLCAELEGEARARAREELEALARKRVWSQPTPFGKSEEEEGQRIR